MEIGGFIKLSTIDFPEKLSCVVFLQGCNLKCIYCHNSHLIPFKKGIISQESILSYIAENKEFLDGVVISGGEPLAQKDVCDFCKKVKELGLSIKIDTNGFFPEQLKKLILLKLVDYVALDIKAPLTPEEYSFIAGVKITENDIKKLKETIFILSSEKIQAEFRTTVLQDYHTLEKIEKIVSEIPENATYVLQQCILKEKITSKEYIINIANHLKNKYKELTIKTRIYEI
ncbi:MAG TPA: anaerobic ribonucleoside-triphosphate reductase activating protein [Nanoarchaeota archaeon]|nr:anaerobic ribonucleoside-triphosphate reductase activating protein [Nanoarchaeota archaeon]